jgi:hypothetical protein
MAIVMFIYIQLTVSQLTMHGGGKVVVACVKHKHEVGSAGKCRTHFFKARSTPPWTRSWTEHSFD